VGALEMGWDGSAWMGRLHSARQQPEKLLVPAARVLLIPATT